MHFLDENVSIAIKKSLKFLPKGSINNTPPLVQIMAWRRRGDKPLSEPMVVNLYASLRLNEFIFLHGERIEYSLKQIKYHQKYRSILVHTMHLHTTFQYINSMMRYTNISCISSDFAMKCVGTWTYPSSLYNFCLTMFFYISFTNKAVQYVRACYDPV